MFARRVMSVNWMLHEDPRTIDISPFVEGFWRLRKSLLILESPVSRLTIAPGDIARALSPKLPLASF